MIKLLNHSGLELRPQCGRNCERTAFTIRTILKYTEFGIIKNRSNCEYSVFAIVFTPRSQLRPQCGRNCERSAFTIRTILNYTEFGIIRKQSVLIMAISPQLNLSNSIDLN